MKNSLRKQIKEKKMIEKIEKKLKKKSIFQDIIHVNNTSAWVTHSPKSFFVENSIFIERSLEIFKKLIN